MNLNNPPWNLFGWFKRLHLWGNWWLAASSWQCIHACITFHAEIFLWNIKSSRWLSPLQPRFGTLQLQALPKARIIFEREEIWDHWWDSEKYNSWWGSWWWLGEVCQVPTCLLWSGLRHHYPTYNVSSSINVSIFHSTWLETFWQTIHICMYVFIYFTYIYIYLIYIYIIILLFIILMLLFPSNGSKFLFLTVLLHPEEFSCTVFILHVHM